jgi:hypothetical protein
MMGDRKLMHRVIVVAIVFLSIACGPIFNPTLPSAAWQSTVDELSALQSGLEFPDHFEDENATRTGEEFDVNDYFTVLDRLSMESGYVLDYVYCYDGMGGYPRLYAQPEDQPRLLTCGDFRGDRGDYLAHVQTDDTEEGFFQFVLLQAVAGQFYLYWHAGYYDDVVICDRDALESIVSGDGVFGEPFSGKQKREARAIDPSPVVELGDEVVTVKIVTFSNWGGFTQETYEIDRDFPHTILNSDYQVLVEYDCGIMF